MKSPKSLLVFALCDFFFALCALLLAFALILPLYLSTQVEHHFDQPGKSVMATITIFTIPIMIAFITFICAGIGLVKRKPWGFYFHLVASGMVALTIIFLPYTILSFIFSFKPSFRGQFFPPLHH